MMLALFWCALIVDPSHLGSAGNPGGAPRRPSSPLAARRMASASLTWS